MATATSLTQHSLSSLTSRPLLRPQPHRCPLRFSFFNPISLSPKCPLVLLPSFNLSCKASGDEAAEPLQEEEGEDDTVFAPPPEGYIRMPYFDEGPEETEEEVAAAYEELYGPAYSGVSVLGNDIYVMDAKLKQPPQRPRDGLEERVVQVRRVTKVVKGGKQLNFRAVVVVGDKQGHVGVGVGKAKEVIAAVQKAVADARRHVITVPLTKYLTFPHRANGKFGAATVMLRPASPGSGVSAGGSVRIVLEMAGVQSALGKQLGSDNALNNCRATIVAMQSMRTFSDVARERGIPVEELWK